MCDESTLHLRYAAGAGCRGHEISGGYCTATSGQNRGNIDRIVWLWEVTEWFKVNLSWKTSVGQLTREFESRPSHIKNTTIWPYFYTYLLIEFAGIREMDRTSSVNERSEKVLTIFSRKWRSESLIALFAFLCLWNSAPLWSAFFGAINLLVYWWIKIKNSLKHFQWERRFMVMVRQLPLTSYATFAVDHEPVF